MPSVSSSFDLDFSQGKATQMVDDNAVHANDPINALTEAVIGAAIEVHRTLGPGYQESIYENALCIELRLRGISFVRQAAFPVLYKGELVGDHRVDILVDHTVIIELKAVESLTRSSAR
jgi:GxxExxY protein